MELVVFAGFLVILEHFWVSFFEFYGDSFAHNADAIYWINEYVGVGGEKVIIVEGYHGCSFGNTTDPQIVGIANTALMDIRRDYGGKSLDAVKLDYVKMVSTMSPTEIADFILDREERACTGSRERVKGCLNEFIRRLTKS